MQTLYRRNETIIQSIVNCTIIGNLKQRLRRILLSIGYTTSKGFKWFIRNSQIAINTRRAGYRRSTRSMASALLILSTS